MNRALDSFAHAKIDEQTLARQVQELVARLRPEVTIERRHDDRVSIPLLFRLTPLDRDREPVHDDAIIVVGKDISRRGLSFFHEHPLTYRRAVVALEHPDFGHFAAEIDVNWCRFTRPGWYESGGRLVRPLEATSDRPATLQPASTQWVRLASLAGGTC